MKKTWEGERILFSGNTDCYQPIEATYRLTRACLEVCRDFQNPCSIITKSALVRRDVDPLGELAKSVGASACISIPFASSELARAIEPYASAPAARFETIRRLSQAGVRVGVNVAPVIPGLNDTEVAEVLERAHEAGATRASIIPIRLPMEVLPVFVERITNAFPQRAKKIVNGIRELRGGKMNEGQFGARFEGKGARWAMVERLFEQKAKTLGMDAGPPDAPSPSPFRRPTAQLSLLPI